MSDFRAYLRASPDELYAALAEAYNELSDTLDAIGETEAAVTDASVRGFFNSMAKTVREREMEASRHALNFNVELPKLKAARESWKARIAFIERLLDDEKRI